MAGVAEGTPIAGEVPVVVARTAVVEEVIITAAATTIGIIRGIGTAVVGAEGTAVRTTTIALRGTTTTGTRGRTRAPEAEGAADTTSETIRTRLVVGKVVTQLKTYRFGMRTKCISQTPTSYASSLMSKEAVAGL